MFCLPMVGQLMISIKDYCIVLSNVLTLVIRSLDITWNSDTNTEYSQDYMFATCLFI